MTAQNNRKNNRRTGFSTLLFVTSALASLGTLSVPFAAHADESWAHLSATAGSFTTDATDPKVTNINVTTGRATAVGNADIYAGDTVNVNADVFAVRDNRTDPTRILGTLNSNGKIIVIDGDGVFFQTGSTVDVAGLIATTGQISDTEIMNNAFGEYQITNLADNIDSIVRMDGQIDIADAGLAAFVAPTVVNNGVINARMGTVALAAGQQVTLDMYGDGLFEVAVDGELADALVKNSGTIAAEGGRVQMSALAAKEVVDTLVNNTGIITASSAVMDGGKIILSGGDKGIVRNGGSLDVSGATNAGEIDISGQAVNLTPASQLTATGDAAVVNVYGTQSTLFRGTLVTGDNADVEASSGGNLSLNADLTLGQGSLISFDPASFTIGVGEASTIESALNNFGVTVDVAATDNIILDADIDTSAQLTDSVLNFQDQDANSDLQVDLNAKILLGSAQTLTGDATVTNVNSNAALIQNAVDISANGATVNIAAGTYAEQVDINKSLDLIGAGVGSTFITALDVLAESYNDGFDSYKAVITAHDADAVNISDLTVDGLDKAAGNGDHFVGILYKDAGGAVDGVDIDNMNGAGADGHAVYIYNTDGMARTVTVQSSTLDAFSKNGVVARGVGLIANILNNVINGTGSGVGISVDQADGAQISDNTIDSTGTGISISEGDQAIVTGNTIENSADNGISVLNSADVELDGNTINTSGDNAIELSNTDNVNVHDNMITAAGYAGILLANSGTNVATVSDNELSDVDFGIYAEGVTGSLLIDGNIVDAQAGSHPGIIGSGIVSYNNQNVDLTNNTIEDFIVGLLVLSNSGYVNVDANTITDVNLGVFAWANQGLSITNNLVNGRTAGGRGTMAGIFVDYSDGAIVGGAGAGNTVTNFDDDGIWVRNSDSSVISHNIVSNIGSEGVFVNESDDAEIASNDLDNIDADGIKLENGAAGSIHDNTVQHAGVDGIAVSGNSGVSVQSNTVYDSGANGIIVSDSAAADISGNKVDLSGVDGIVVVSSAGALIDSNKINTLYGGATSGDDGIDVSNSANVEISSNTVDNSDDNGIELSNTDNVNVHDNSVTDAGDTGIFLENSGTNTAAITANTITNVENGVVAASIAGSLLIDNNIVDALSGYHPYAGTAGVQVQYSSDVRITNNTLDDFAVGVNISNNSGYVNLDANTITNTGSFGVYARSNQGLVITNNDVDGRTAGGYGGIAGIYVDKSHGAVIGGVGQGNSVQHFSGAGIRLLNTRDAVIEYNTVSNIRYHGIQAALGTIKGLVINENDISQVGSDGINVATARDVTVSNNDLTNIGRDGINLSNITSSSYDLLVTGNTVDTAGNDGIVVTDSDNSTISQNSVSNASGNGIFVDPSSNVLVDENTLIGNNVGIAFQDVDNSVISNNIITDSLTSGIDLLDVDAIEILDNEITGSGSNGLHARGVDNGVIILSGNVFTDNPVGALFESGAIDLSDALNPNSFINTVSGDTPTGLEFALAGADTSRLTITGQTLGSTIFEGFEALGSYYVYLTDGSILSASTGDPLVIDGLDASYDGFVPATTGGVLTLAEYTYLESRIWDADDPAVNGRGQIFVGAVPELDNKDAFNQFSAVSSGQSGLSLTITGMPYVTSFGLNLANIAPAAGDENDLANIEPAAGGIEDALQNIEPAAGAENVACWGQALDASLTRAVSYNFNASPAQALSNAATCGAAEF